MTAPDDLDEAHERIRRLIDPHRDHEDELSDKQRGKLQGYRNALKVIGGDDRDERLGR